MANSWAIGLYSYSCKHSGEHGFKSFYENTLAVFQQARITPTYFAVEGVGYKGDLTRFGGRSHAKALKTEFSGIDVISVVANPKESCEPGYDSFASASLGYTEATGETLLCLAMEERFLEFGGSDFESALVSLVCSGDWDFGYAFSQPIEKKPEFHVLGLDSGVLSQEERRMLNAWYASRPEERLCKIRDIYPYMILNKAQLKMRVSNTQTLEDIARLDLRTELRRISKAPLWLWKIRCDAIMDVREKLIDSGVLITRN